MRHRSSFSIMGRLVVLVRPLAGFMALAVGLGLVGHLCAAALTALAGCALLDLLGLPAPLAAGPALIALGVCALLRGPLHYGEQACNHFIAFRLLALIRSKVFSALRRLCPAKLEGKDRGELISLITSDIELLEVFYAHTISPAAIALLFSAVLCLALAAFHWTLGLLALAAYITVGILLPVLAARRAGDQGKRLRDGAGALSAYVLDSLRGLPQLLQFGAGAARLEGMDRMARALSAHEGRMKRIAGESTALTGAVITLFDLAMLLACTALYLNGLVGFDGVVLPVLAFMSSFGPVVALSALGSTLQPTLAAGDRVLDILDETPVVDEVAGQPGVTFSGAGADHVTFSYGGERVLTDLSIPVPEHQVVGIVGRSGSGKSTLLKLFMRFWEADGGQVTVSGTPVGRVNTADLRDMEALVTQETHLFRDSIANNLRIARLDATREQMEQACRKAAIHDFIQTLPQGYDTPVGELGDTLSGGERQRLGLARAFLHDAPFLLLDEPTSNLDSLNEAVILRALHREREGRTVVLVSHRPSTMGIADTVYSVENGRVS